MHLLLAAVLAHVKDLDEGSGSCSGGGQGCGLGVVAEPDQIAADLVGSEGLSPCGKPHLGDSERHRSEQRSVEEAEGCTMTTTSLLGLPGLEGNRMEPGSIG